MTERNRRRRSVPLLEWGKSLLLLLLTATAVLLLLHFLLGTRLGRFLPEPGSVLADVSAEQEEGVVFPPRVALSAWNGVSLSRYGLQYDLPSSDALFASTAVLLREALTNPGPRRAVSRQDWQRALSRSSCLYFDFLGAVPLGVLSGWLSGGSAPAPEGCARRLALSAMDGEVTLYFQDWPSGRCYACRAELLSVAQLEQAVFALGGNGALFAFERESYSALAPDTMLLPRTPRPRTYYASQPVPVDSGDSAQNSAALRTLLDALQFPDTSYRYWAPEGLVFRSGGDTLRLSQDAVVTYSADAAASRYPVPCQGEQAAAYDAAEACRRLVSRSAGALCGEGRVYLSSMQETKGGWQVDFHYCLDGADVQVGEEGYAARFQVRGAEIVSFSICLRSYTAAGGAAELLPEEQAVAALRAMGDEGCELVLCYQDLANGLLSANWLALPPG